MSMFFALLFGNLSLFSCHSDRFPARGVHGARLTYTVPVITPDTGYVSTISYNVFYYKDLILYKYPYQFDSTFNGKPTLQEKRYACFVFHRDSGYGYNYVMPDTGRRLPVDSMLRSISFQGSSFDSLANKPPDSVYSDAEGDALKAYQRTPGPEAFTITFHYTQKIKGIAETFSRAMDNIKGMKLFKITIEGHGAWYPMLHQTMPKRRYVYEMSAFTPQDPAEIMGYFDRYARR